MIKPLNKSRRCQVTGFQKQNKSIDTYGSIKVEHIVICDRVDNRQVLAMVLANVRGLGDRDSRILIWVHSEHVSGRTRRMHRDEQHNLAGV